MSNRGEEGRHLCHQGLPIVAKCANDPLYKLCWKLKLLCRSNHSASRTSLIIDAQLWYISTCSYVQFRRPPVALLLSVQPTFPRVYRGAGRRVYRGAGRDCEGSEGCDGDEGRSHLVTDSPGSHACTNEHQNRSWSQILWGDKYENVTSSIHLLILHVGILFAFVRVARNSSVYGQKATTEFFGLNILHKLHPSKVCVTTTCSLNYCSTHYTGLM